jgi:hypothetical protein
VFISGCIHIILKAGETGMEQPVGFTAVSFALQLFDARPGFFSATR